jgi:hypothetical protein
MSSDIIVAFITGVMGPVTLLYVKNLLDKRKKKPDMLHDALKVGELVMSKIEHIRDEINCDRVWVTQFHNGGNFYPTGKSMAKFSMIYEVVSSGISIENMDFKDVLLTPFSDHFMPFFDDKKYSLDTNETEHPSTWKNYLFNKGIKHDYGFVIENMTQEEINDFIHGFKHGVSLTNGTH